MVNYPYGMQQKVFQCEDHHLDSIKQFLEKAYHACMQHMNKPVLIETMNGQTIQGTIVNVDNQYVYLQPAAAGNRNYPYGPGPFPFYGPYPTPYPYGLGPYNPYAQAILPLALFDLLAIALI